MAVARTARHNTRASAAAGKASVAIVLVIVIMAVLSMLVLCITAIPLARADTMPNAVLRSVPATQHIYDPARLPLEQVVRDAMRAYYAGQTGFALKALRHAASGGSLAAAWKLGRMYKAGDGVARDPVKAFHYFSQAARAYDGNEARFAGQSAFVSDSLVSLGSYYLDGIDDFLTPDRARARGLFSWAASYFGDRDAQSRLGRLYLEADPPDIKMAARWLRLAAEKGQLEAQALLGDLLCLQGGRAPRQRASGLEWLTVARLRVGGNQDLKWVFERHERCAALLDAPTRQRVTASARMRLGVLVSPAESH